MPHITRREIRLQDRPVGSFSTESAIGSPEAVERAAETIRGLSLWRLYSGGKKAYIVGAFPPQEGVEHRAFHLACSAWPEWNDKGSGACKGGPGAFSPDSRETQVLLLPGTAAPDLLAERDRLRRENDELRRQEGELLAEAERLRARVAEVEPDAEAWGGFRGYMRGTRADLSTRLVHRDQEIERLKAENEALLADQDESCDQETADAASLVALTQQRDALAELLHLTLGALHRCEPADINAANFQPETITARSLAALRLAGRLP